MVRRTVTYVDLDGNERTEEFLFHLNKMEVMEMDARYKDGMTAHLEKITKEGEEEFPKIIAFLKELLLYSYGRREGDKFIKTPEMRNEFAQSEAFSEVLYSLALDAADGGADAFMEALIPSAKLRK